MKKITSAALLLLFFLLGGVGLVQGQEAGKLSGIVKDSLSGLPMPGASISVIPVQQEKAADHTQTDSKGVFLIKKLPAGTYYVSVGYSGYHAQKSAPFSIAAGQEYNLGAIKMAIQNNKLSIVTVKAKKPFITQTAGKVVMNISESGLASGGSSYDLLQTAPGIIMGSNGLPTYNGKRVIVLIDGRPTNTSGEDLKALLSSLQSNAIEKIELVSNPGARVDAEGGAAVINIKLVKSKNLGTNGTLVTTVGTGRWLRTSNSLSINHRSKKANVFGGYDFGRQSQYFENRSHRNIGIDATVTENEYEIRKRSNHSLRLGADFEKSKTLSYGFLFKSFLNYRDRDVNNLSVLSDMSLLEDSSSRVSTKGAARFFSPSVNIWMKKVLDSSGKELNLTADYMNYQKRWSDDFVTRFFDKNNVEKGNTFMLRDQSPANNNIYSFAADYLQPVKKGRWEMGAKMRVSRTDNNAIWEVFNNPNWITDAQRTNHFIFTEKVLAGYMSLSRQYGKYEITTGLRAEQTWSAGRSVTLNQVNENNYFQLFPNLSVARNFGKKHLFNLSYAKSIQRFGYDVVNPFIVYQSQFSAQAGNPQIRPELAHAIELQHIFKNNLSTTIGYTTTVRSLADVFKQDTLTGTLYQTYENLAGTQQWFTTVSYNKSLTKNWMTSNSISGYHVTTNTNLSGSNSTGNKSVSANSIYINSYNRFLFAKKNVLEVSVQYRSPFALGIYTVNTYFRTNLALSRNILKGFGSFKISVADVFNTVKNINTVNGFQGINGWFESKAESRFLYGTLTVKFGNRNVKANKNRKTGIEEEKARLGSN